MSQLLPPSAFEFVHPVDNTISTLRASGYRQDVEISSSEAMADKDVKILESAMKNQSTLIEQLNAKCSVYENDIENLKKKVVYYDNFCPIYYLPN